VDEKLDTTQQCVLTISWAASNKVLVSRSREEILPLCSTLVRPHLDSCVQLWSPQYKTDMDLAEPLSIIFERSWRTGEVPENWRKANVTPVFKKGNKEDPGNNRPVSLTSIPGKVMEQLILEVIMKQVEEKRVSGVVSMDSPRGNHA